MYKQVNFINFILIKEKYLFKQYLHLKTSLVPRIFLKINKKKKNKKEKIFFNISVKFKFCG